MLRKLSGYRAAQKRGNGSEGGERKGEGGVRYCVSAGRDWQSSGRQNLDKFEGIKTKTAGSSQKGRFNSCELP